MLVVGSELYKSMDGKGKVGRIPKKCLRFRFQPSTSSSRKPPYSAIDPMLWFAMMLCALMEIKGSLELENIVVVTVIISVSSGFFMK